MSASVQVSEQVHESAIPSASSAGEGAAHSTVFWASDEAISLVQQVFFSRELPPLAVVFAGIDHGSGCSGVCASVAAALANAGKTVCLVEANFRSPALCELFGTTSRAGLAHALFRGGPIRSFAKLVGPGELWLLACGELSVDSPSLLGSEQLKARLDELESEFDFVIIDAPPVTRYADALQLGRLADGVVLVLEAGATRSEAALKAATDLRASNISILAAVLNKREFPIPEKIYRML